MDEPFLEPVKNPKQLLTVSVCAAQSDPEIPDEISEQFGKLLRTKLYEEASVQEGTDIIIIYRIIDINPKTKMKRWMIGCEKGDSGEGTLTTEVTYLDRDKNILGKIVAEGKTHNDLFGSTFSNALIGAADEVVQHTLQTFYPKIITKQG